MLFYLLLMMFSGSFRNSLFAARDEAALEKTASLLSRDEVALHLVLIKAP